MRASWVYGEFGTFKFSQQGHMKQAVGGVFKQLFDPRLPVKLQAATSIQKLLHNQEAEQLLKPHLKDILEVYLKMMSEIDSEELVNALEEIVSFFSEDIGPYAI